MTILDWLLNGTIDVGFGQVVSVRDIIGNIFGFASAILGMRKKVWAWPIGIIGNIILFTVFAGSLFGDTSRIDMYGQAGRQLFFLALAIYGWITWGRSKEKTDNAVNPHWASNKQRLWLLLGLFGGTFLLYFPFKWLHGASGSQWVAPDYFFVCDAWIFVGSALATYGMARGWVEFWLIWIAVDIVGVPLLISNGYHATAVMYFLYGLLALWGFVVWAKDNRKSKLYTVRDTASPQFDPDTSQEVK